MGAERKSTWALGLAIGAMVIALVVAAFICWGAPAELPVARSSSDLVWLRQETVTLTATGSEGAATGSASTDRNLHGYVYAVHVDYGAAVTTTTDITISQAAPALTVMAKADSATDAWFYPIVQQTGADGAAVSAQYEKVLVADALDVSAAQTTSGTVAMVTVYWGQ